MKAVFFDRDGTLNEEVGYIDSLSRFRLLPSASHAVLEVNRAGLLAVVITNQSGVGRGLFPETMVESIHEQLRQELRHLGAHLDAIYYCPHHPDAEVLEYRMECTCRKPGTGMMEQAAERFGIRLEESFVIGDRLLDVQMAHRAGAGGILVRTGFGKEEWKLQGVDGTVNPDHIAENAYDAVQWILAGLK